VDPTAVFWIGHIQSTLVADGTHQTSVYSSLTFKYSSHCGNKAYFPAWKKPSCSAGIEEVTACFTTASVSRHFLSRYLLRGQKRKKMTISSTANRTGACYGTAAEMIRTTLPTVLISAAIVSVSWNPLKKHPAGKKTPTWSKLSLLGYWNLTRVILRRDETLFQRHGKCLFAKARQMLKSQRWLGEGVMRIIWYPFTI